LSNVYFYFQKTDYVVHDGDEKRGDSFMPYHKNKQQAFQAAQQGTQQAKDLYDSLVDNDPNYGSMVKRLKNEINEAFENINNALEVASETQRKRLETFREELQKIVSDINEE
jgi:hypothetical protein